jgi:hypothetical protein
MTTTVDIKPDTAAAPCAACGMPATAVEGQRSQRQGVSLGDGRFVLLMLCLDAAGCQARTRMGLTPAGYAKLIKSGAKP